MRPTRAEVMHMEAFFKTIELPKQLQLHKSTRQLDMPKFLKESIEMAKDPEVMDVIVNRRWHWVVIIKEILMKK